MGVSGPQAACAGGRPGQGDATDRGSDARRDHLPGRSPARPPAHRRQPRARHRRPRVGRRRTPRPSCSPTAASTSPAPSTCSRRCSPTAGWRVVSWDHRGHGDSEHAALYNWEADLRDARGRARLGDRRRRCPSSATPRAAASCSSWPTRCPHRVSHLVNLDGLPSRRSFPTCPTTSARSCMAKELTPLARPPPALVDAAARSPAPSTSWPSGARRMNPRLRRRLAALPGDGRRPRGCRRLALEDRPDACASVASARGGPSGR